MTSSELNLKEQIHDNLFSDIVNGVYQLGATLHEKSLMEKYGVSRAPIREALIQSCSEDVLRNYPRRGYGVTEVNEGDIQNIIRYRILLECGLMQWYGGYTDDGFTEKLEHHDPYHQQRQGEGLTALGHWLDNIGFCLLSFSNYQNDYAYKKLQESMITWTRLYAQKRPRQWHSPISYDADGLHVAIVDYPKQENYSMASNILKADVEDRTTT